MGKSKLQFNLNCDLSHFGNLIWYIKIRFEAPAIRFEIFVIRFEKVKSREIARIVSN